VLILMVLGLIVLGLVPLDATGGTAVVNVVDVVGTTVTGIVLDEDGVELIGDDEEVDTLAGEEAAVVEEDTELVFDSSDDASGGAGGALAVEFDKNPGLNAMENASIGH